MKCGWEEEGDIYDPNRHIIQMPWWKLCAFTVGKVFAQARRNYQARPESGHRRVLTAFAETCQLMFPFRTSISIFYSSSLQIAIQYFWENLNLYKTR